MGVGARKSSTNSQKGAPFGCSVLLENLLKSVVLILSEAISQNVLHDIDHRHKQFLIVSILEIQPDQPP